MMTQFHNTSQVDEIYAPAEPNLVEAGSGWGSDGWNILELHLRSTPAPISEFQQKVYLFFIDFLFRGDGGWGRSPACVR